MLADDPAKRAVERWWLIYTPVWGAITGIVMVGGFVWLAGRYVLTTTFGLLAFALLASLDEPRTIVCSSRFSRALFDHRIRFASHRHDQLQDAGARAVRQRYGNLFRKSGTGWHEVTVVVRFWIITMMLVLFGLSTLKLR